jgi:hypothetical protein
MHTLRRQANLVAVGSGSERISVRVSQEQGNVLLRRQTLETSDDGQ